MNINTLVDKYIQLRDKKAEMKKAFEVKVAVVDNAMEKVEGILLRHFESTGSESVRTEAGTAYRSTRTSATVADWDSFLNHVKEHESWEMLEHRANKKAVEEYKAANDDLPPGLNWREEVTVNIRRS